MRFLKVTASRFGPLVDQTLELSPGMNVVCGPNEAGKSTWHAAIYAALCGMKRARGRRSRDDQDFTDRHRPWNGDEWKVAGEIVLSAGRTVELHHDLDGRVDSRATDALVGTDVSHEIINDGAPDGSVWLGLDRRTFLATACVRQAEVAFVVQESNLLQEHLQRAAATAGADETAARALDHLKEYQSEHVGLDRANSTKPLRAAKEALQECRRDVEEARDQQRRFAQMVLGLDEAKSRARQAQSRLLQARAAGVELKARAASAKASRARELAADFPDGRAPSRDDDEAIARRARAALQAWDGRPVPTSFEGESAEELAAQLQTLPEMPEGDLTPSRDLEEEYRRWMAARSDVRAAREGEPQIAPVPPTSLGESELRELAHILERDPPHPDEAVEEEIKAAATQVEQTRPWTGYAVSATGAMLAALSGAAGFLGFTTIALSVAGGVLGGVLLVTGVSMASRARAQQAVLRARLDELGRRRREYEQALREFEDARRRTVERLEAEGIEADPEAVRESADELAQAASRRQEHQRWRTRLDTAQATFDNVAARFTSALSERGIQVAGDLERAWSAYREACSARADQARRAGRRTDLQGRLEARRQLEQQHARDVEGLEQARRRLDAAASACAVPVHGAPEDVCAEILRWLDARDEDLKEHEDQIRRWGELQSLLDGRRPEDLEAEAVSLQRNLRDLVAHLQQEGLEPAEGDIEALSEAYEHARDVASLAEGAVKEASEKRKDLGDAEARLGDAERELQRVKNLEETLEQTRTFLEHAQDRVQRDIAPRLSAEIERHLPSVTGGRYSQVRVNPDDLQIQVLDDEQEWRRADQLSHGTQEQIYLLLRAAMARILPKYNETCPLILDDVTVHSDERRTIAVLDTLRELSSEQQVILFSQEQEVLTWAERRLGEGDRVGRLRLFGSSIRAEPRGRVPAQRVPDDPALEGHGGGKAAEVEESDPSPEMPPKKAAGAAKRPAIRPRRTT